MYARCPGCGADVEERAGQETLVCPECGHSFPSRLGDLFESQSPQLRWMAVTTRGAADAYAPGGYGSDRGDGSDRSDGGDDGDYGDDGDDGVDRARPMPAAPPGMGGWGAEEPLAAMWGILRRAAHAVALLGIATLAIVVLLDLLILAWGYFMVKDAAMLGLLRGVLFLIVPYPVGESAWTGWEALGLGTALAVGGVALLLVQRSGRVPGLGGVGTRAVAIMMFLGGLGACAWGAYLASSGHLDSALATPSYLPTPVSALRLRFNLLASWHGVLVGVILASFTLMAIKDGPDLLRRLRRPDGSLRLPTVRTDNTWISVFRIYLAILFFYVVYYALLDMFTIEPTVPAFSEQPLYQQLYAFAHASVWEEVATRTLMLGLPLYLYYGMARKEAPPWWRFAVGGHFEICNAAFALIVFQGLVFALAHVSSWDLWKVLPTTISGMAFGYLFLRRGIWAAIALHFTFDYVGMTGTVLAGSLSGAPLAMDLLTLLWILAGGLLFVHYVLTVADEGPRRLREALRRPHGCRKP